MESNLAEARNATTVYYLSIEHKELIYAILSWVGKVAEGHHSPSAEDVWLATEEGAYACTLVSTHLTGILNKPESF